MDAEVSINLNKERKVQKESNASTELRGTVVKATTFIAGCGIVRLTQPHEGMDLAVINYETEGRELLLVGDNIPVGTEVIITEFTRGGDAYYVAKVRLA